MREDYLTVSEGQEPSHGFVALLAGEFVMKDVEMVPPRPR